MLISMNWISDFVDLSGIDKKQLIKHFTLSTAEVEDIYEYGIDVEKVVVGKILEVNNHPNSNKLHLLRVDTGDEIVNCVCGAPNVKEGIKVPFAKVGGKVNGLNIASTEIAGYISDGMCCSEKELGISSDHSGLMILDDECPIGKDIKSLFGIEDIVFEIDNKSLTNRPDLWGHFGIAREFAAITGRTLKNCEIYSPDNSSDKPDVDIKIYDSENCYRYTSAIVNNINRKVSPVDMRIRLFYCGLRSINFLADLTNYVMLELGQPMHAFDYDKVKNIRVKRYDQKFDFTTLDGSVRQMDENSLMICTDDIPVAVAGIMGGLDSEITETTNSLLLESANFNGVCIRKTSSRIGLRTDASMRYEKMLDPELTITAALRYLMLLKRYDPSANIVTNITDVYNYSYPEINIKFDKSYVDRYTGIDISVERIYDTLTALGFKVILDGDKFSVDVPSWRRTKDISIKADIIEEITRIYGYDNFEVKPPEFPLEPIPLEKNKYVENSFKNILANRYSLHEIHTYIWCDNKKYKSIGVEVPDNVRIINSQSNENTILRDTIIPSQLCAITDNKHFADDFGVFEIGRVVKGLDKDNKCIENKVMGISLISKNMTEKHLFFKMRDMILYLFSSIGLTKPVFMEKTNHCSWANPKNDYELYISSQPVGNIYTLHPKNRNLIDRKSSVVCVELNIDDILRLNKESYVFEEPSKYQGIDFDLTVIVDNSIPYESIIKVITPESYDILHDVDFVGIYQDPLTPDKKNVSVRMKYLSNDRTLELSEVQGIVDKIINKFEENGFVVKK